MASTEHNQGSELFAEILSRAEVLVGLGPAQVEGWVSGLFTVLETDAELEAFIGWCSEHPSPAGALACSGLAVLAEPAVAGAAGAAFDSMVGLVAEADLATAERLGRWAGESAWRIEAPFGNSLAVGFGTGDDAHAVLAEVDASGRLIDLQVCEIAGLGVDETDDGPPGVTVHPADPADVLKRIAQAWAATAGAGDVEVGTALLANQHLVRKRLAAAGHEVAVLAGTTETADLTRGMSPAEIDRANQAAVATLRAAVGDPAPGVVADPTWVGVVRGDIADASPREREGLLWLEWADWLGVGIGLIRVGSGAATDGSALVDLINRCPEVSSTVPAQDRDYAEWALEVAADFLADAGLVQDGCLTARGAETLHPSLFAAWN